MYIGEAVAGDVPLMPAPVPRVGRDEGAVSSHGENHLRRSATDITCIYDA